MTAIKIVVLASGRGSNLGALIAARDSGRLALEIALVASDRTGAAALALARAAGIACVGLTPRDYASRDDFDRALFAAIEQVQPTFIVCAGYMRLISADVVARWSGRMLNIHPSLLPAYPGLDTHTRALADGVRWHGASVHFVSAEVDAGPVLAQVRIAVEPADRPASLAARLLPHEHRLLVESLRLCCTRVVRVDGGAIMLDGAPLARPLQLTADGQLQ